MKRRLLSAFLAVMMVLTMAPVAFAADEGDTLQSKINNASDTVTLTQNYAEDITIPAGKNITLDLNGKTLTNKTGHTITVEQGATLTIEGNGTVDNITHGKAALVNYGTAMLNNGVTLKRSSEKGTLAPYNNGGNSYYTILNDKGATMTINNATVENSGGYSSAIRNGGDSKCNNESYLTINDGNFSGGLNAVKNDELGILTINGGTFSNSSQYVVMNWHKAVINAGTFSAKESSDAVLQTASYDPVRGVGKLEITGGTFKRTGTQDMIYPNFIDGKGNQYPGTASITGGTFATDVSAYVAEGYVQNNGTVEQLGETNAVAKVGNTYYKTLAEAVAAAPGDSTVVLLKDATLSKMVVIKKNLDIDLGGHKLSRAGSLLDIYNKTTIKNGTIDCTFNGDGTSCAVWVNTVANLTVEKNVTFTTSDKAFAVAFDSSCTTSSVAFKGTITGGNGITMNGQIKDTATSNKLIIDGATIKVNGHGLYLAGFANTEFTINDSVISGATGIEIRAGKLNIANSSISGNGAFSCEPNDGGTTTDGAGIAIAQHTTKLPIDVTISDGEISGTYAIYESNPQKNDADSIAKIKLAVTGGKFNGALYSEDIKGFITGGLFTSDPSDYCADNLTGVSSGNTTYPWTVGEKSADTKPAEVADATVAATVDKNASEAAKDAAKEIGGAMMAQNEVIKAAAKNEANQNTIEATTKVEGNTTVTDKLNAALPTGTTVSASDVKIVYQTYIDVEVKAATKENSNFTELTVELTPMYRVIAAPSTETNYNVDADKDTSKAVNAVQIVGEKPLTLTGKYEVTLHLPDGFVVPSDNKLSIKHQKSSGVEYYTGTVDTTSGTKMVTFETNGFSPFTISAVAAYVGTTAYPTLQEAANAANSGDTIVVKNGASHDLTFTATKSVKVKNETGADVTVKFNGTDKKFGDGETETFTYTKPSSGGSSGGSSSGKTTYKVTTSAVNNGGVNASPSNAEKGATITITLSPDKGYKLDKLTVTDGSGKTVSTVKKSDTVYTFTMPASAVKVGVSYVKATETPSETKFNDVSANDWFASAVDYVTGKGMMNGTADNTFSPKANTTRGMVVTVLYRLENQPSTSAASFTDVASGAYYANAVAWANANGIVSGYGSGKFGPNDKVTREQLAAILYRYAQYKKYDVSVGEDTNILSYDDAQSISSYAIPAIQWACGAGVVTGKSGSKLDPKGNATRAEVAAMLMRFCENVK